MLTSGLVADDPHRLDPAILERVEEIGGGQPAHGGDAGGASGMPTTAFISSPVGLGGDLAIAGQHVRETADLAAAHRVRLPRE